MSFLGCIGHLISGAGLQELLETIYASNSVVHMMTGKAGSRAVRGHVLVENALNAMRMASAFSVVMQNLTTYTGSSESGNSLPSNATMPYGDLAGEITASDVISSTVLDRIHIKINRQGYIV